jgi:phosphohistidine phosphatase
MDVIFFRHGVAVDREDWDGPDSDRPLTEDGNERTKLASRGLRKLEPTPTVILSSPFVRAKQTAEIAKEELALDAKIEFTEDLIPEAGPDRLLARLAKFDQNSVVLCVGHEPHISTAVSAMICRLSTTSLEIKKAGACCVRYSAQPRAGKGTLLWLIPAKILRAVGSR